MQDKLDFLKTWLGTGSINLFGLPMSGKDTVGVHLANDLAAEFLSSGDIIRAHEAETGVDYTGGGALAPTDVFYDIILPYFKHEDLEGRPLILSSIGRWSGEEDEIMRAAREGRHPIKVVVKLDLSETNVRNRWQAAQNLQDRGRRADDTTPEIFEKRLGEFYEKTVPVLTHYDELGLLVTVNAAATREEVYTSVVDALYDFAKNNEKES